MNDAPGDAPANAQPLLQMHAIRKIYGAGAAEVRALDGVDLDIHRGEFVAVMGPSGSGKSTCMNILGCLDVPSAGAYRFQGVDVSTLNRNELALLRRHFMGFVFQSFNLLPRMSAVANVELPLVYEGVRPAERRRRALITLDSVGLAHRASALPNELSGGQQQRVAIARALVTEPPLLLTDEPTGNLDTTTAREIMEQFVALRESRDITIVMVTHEPDIAAWAERVVYFIDGRIDRDGIPAEVLA